MLWLFLSLLVAFFESIKVVLSKKSFNIKNIDEYVASWSLRFFASLFLLPLLFFIQIPSIGNRFWEALLIRDGLVLITTILYMKAIKSSDISIVHPMLNFYPIFLIFTAPVFLGEFPNTYGLIGVLLIVFGAYSMNMSKLKKGFFAPIKAILKEKGPGYMLGVAFLWSIAANYDKIGIMDSSPIFWAITSNILLVLLLSPIMLLKSKNIKEQIIPNIKILSSIGLSSALLLITQMIAFSLTYIVYVSALRTTSAIMSVIFGYLIFKEKNIKERLFGATIMVIGVVVIALT
ncbi:MAG: EamA family transporter [Candidatus Aenigmarchaeota archaeon]|nr:EamA family transporter [Candidatus Aenigmarchaeota archaeon]